LKTLIKLLIFNLDDRSLRFDRLFSKLKRYIKSRRDHMTWDHVSHKSSPQIALLDNWLSHKNNTQSFIKICFICHNHYKSYSSRLRSFSNWALWLTERMNLNSYTRLLLFSRILNRSYRARRDSLNISRDWNDKNCQCAIWETDRSMNCEENQLSRKTIRRHN
jgi:hypothetical protein